MYRVTLTEEQRIELRRRIRDRETLPSVRERLEMVRLSDAGWKVPRIAAHVGQHEQTVRYWIKAFVGKIKNSSGNAGFDALADKPRGGKTSALTPAILAAAQDEIRRGNRTWTAGQIASWVSEQHGVHLSADRMRVHLHRAGLSYKRTSRSLRHKQKEEETAPKKADFETLKKGAMPG
jgi:putative transposase